MAGRAPYAGRAHFVGSISASPWASRWSARRSSSDQREPQPEGDYKSRSDRRPRRAPARQRTVFTRKIDQSTASSRENKLQKRGTFSARQKTYLNSPHLPRIPPQTHHKKPSKEMHFSQNTPQKRSKNSKAPSSHQGLNFFLKLSTGKPLLRLLQPLHHAR
jgi:hypothetical protein